LHALRRTRIGTNALIVCGFAVGFQVGKEKAIVGTDPVALPATRSCLDCSVEPDAMLTAVGGVRRRRVRVDIHRPMSVD